MIKLSIIGAGGHARSVIAMLNDLGIFVEGIYDDYTIINENIFGIPCKNISEIPEKFKVILAVGDNIKRLKKIREFHDMLYEKPIIHPTVYFHKSLKVGKSTMVFPNVTINGLVKIGNNCIINSCSIIEHESVIGDNCHISIGSIISGRVKIGSNCLIGAGAVILDGVEICGNVIVGAGSVVIENITYPGTYVGSPAKKIK